MQKEKNTHTQRKQNVYQKSKTEGFKKEINTKKQILLESKPNKKVFIRKVVDYIYYEFYFYSFSIQSAWRSQQNKEEKKTNHVILKKRKNTLQNTWCEAGEYTRERERTVKEEGIYFEQISKLSGSEPDLTRTKKKMVPVTAEKMVHLKFFSLIKCTIVRVSASKQQDTAECSGGREGEEETKTLRTVSK